MEDSVTPLQLYDFFERNPNTDITDAEGITHYYAFWCQHRLEWLESQAKGYAYDLKMLHPNTPAFFYTEKELRRVHSQITKLHSARQYPSVGKVILTSTPMPPIESFFETAWRTVKSFVGK
jgi:hypothetical protein